MSTRESLSALAVTNEGMDTFMESISNHVRCLADYTTYISTAAVCRLADQIDRAQIRAGDNAANALLATVRRYL